MELISRIEKRGSKSNFYTKNATEEVSAETIEKWHKAKPKHGLQDVVGMEEQKQILEQEVIFLSEERIGDTINHARKYLFYGPPGSGKTYLIEAFAHDLMEKGFSFIQLVGADIHQSLVGVGEKPCGSLSRKQLIMHPRSSLLTT